MNHFTSIAGRSFLSRLIPVSHCRCFCYEQFRARQDGYALPSLLLLVVILSLLAFAALTGNYLQKQLALRSVSRVGAEYAAQSALAKTIVSLNSPQQYTERLKNPPQQFDYDDGGQATVQLERWGCYGLAVSRATHKEARAERMALIGQRTGASFDHALIFASTDHQLVFTGSTSVRGSIVTGPLGATTGALIGRPSMGSQAIMENIRKEAAPTLPSFSSDEMQKEVNEYSRLLAGVYPNDTPPGDILTFSRSQPIVLDGERIPPDVRYVAVAGDAILTGTLDRRRPPLYILVRGKVSFRSPVRLDGLIAILSQKEIVVLEDSHVDHAILYSATQIELKESASVSAQVFSPLIVLRAGADATYPSLLVSLSPQAKSITPTGIVLEQGSVLEGTLLSLTPRDKAQHPAVVIQTGASVTGAIYSENMVTLDGSVVGTVMTKDFYFEVAPTSYLGWLRSAKIDRRSRPDGFLAPIGFRESFRLDILEWL